MNNIVKWYDINDMTPEDFDNIKEFRYNIKNYSEFTSYQMKNFYIFKILDLDEKSKTRYYGMAVNKNLADKLLKLYENKKG